MSNKKVLVLGTNAGQLDLIKHMKSLGWHVISCAHKAGNVGDAYSDEFHLVDIINPDAVKALAVKVNADLVFSISSDIAITTAITVSEQLSLPHFYNSDLVDLFNKKQRLRSVLNENKVSEVAYVCVKDASQKVVWTDFPCIVKPVDSQGQRGVQKVYNQDQLDKAVIEACEISQSGDAIVEDFLDGVEVSCNVLVNNGEIIFEVLSERLVHGGDLTGIPQGHLVPCANVDRLTHDAAIKVVHDVVKLLEVTDGCLYFQMKTTTKGIKIIEIAPRLDGCHMWRLIKHATNRNFLEATVATLLGEEIDRNKVEVNFNKHYELMFQQTPPGVKFSIADHPKPEDVLYHEYRYDEGEAIYAINGKLEVVGYYVREYDGKAHLEG